MRNESRRALALSGPIWISGSVRESGWAHVLSGVPLFCRHKLSDMHDIKDVVKADILSGENPDEKKEAAKAVRKAFMARYQAGTNPWFFSKLRF